MSTDRAAPSWTQHLAAAAEMGLDAREAYETFDGLEMQLRRAGRECQERLRRALDDELEYLATTGEGSS